MIEIITVENGHGAEFEKSVNAYLKDGWEILSTSSCVLQSEAYNFGPWFIAILGLPDNSKK